MRSRRSSATARGARRVQTDLRGLDEPKRRTLQALRRTILEIVPEAEQVSRRPSPAEGAREETDRGASQGASPGLAAVAASV